MTILAFLLIPAAVVAFGAAAARTAPEQRPGFNERPEHDSWRIV